MKTPINKILAFFTVALLITNIVLVYFLWKDKKPNSHSDKGKSNKGDWMVDELKLDEKQKVQHKEIKDAHFASLKPVFDSITSGRSHLYKLLKEPQINDSLVNMYTKAVGEQQSLISLYTFEHFKKMRAICTPEQQVKLDELIQKLVQNMGKRGSKPKPDTN